MSDFKKTYLGQVFLKKNSNVVDIMTRGIMHEKLLEIGPGKGVLTKRLVRLVKDIKAIEIDYDLYLELQSHFLHQKNITFYNCNFLDRPELAFGRYIIGSLPYSSAWKIINAICGLRYWLGARLLLQSEMIIKLTTPTRRSMIIYPFVSCKIIKRYIKPIEWSSPPKVGGGIIELTPRRICYIQDISLWKDMILFLWRQPGKMLGKRMISEKWSLARLRPAQLSTKMLMKEYRVRFLIKWYMRP